MAMDLMDMIRAAGPRQPQPKPPSRPSPSLDRWPGDTAMPGRPGMPSTGTPPPNPYPNIGPPVATGPVARPPRPPTQPGAPAVPTGQPWNKGGYQPPQVGWGSNAGQPRPGNTPYAQPPWQPAYGNPQQYQQGMGQRPPTYPPQMRPQQQPFQYQQQGAQPWQTGNQQAPQPGGVPPWMQFAQRPNYQQQFNPYSMPTQGMVRLQTPGQGYDSFMGSWQNPMQGMINNRPTWRPSPAMPSIPQIPAMPQYQGPPNPWAQAVPSAQPAQQNQQSPTMADYLRVMRGY